MGYALQKAEQERIRRALAFANLERVTSDDEIYSLFDEAIESRWDCLIDKNGQAHSTSSVLRLKEIGDDARVILEREREDFVERLEDLLRAPRTFSKEHGAYVLELARKAVVIGEFVVDARGRLAERFQISPGGIEGACGYALALLADQTRPWRSRLRRCPWPKCRHFFLATPNPRGGPRDKYCSDACRRAKNTSHVKAWRVKYDK